MDSRPQRSRTALRRGLAIVVTIAAATVGAAVVSAAPAHAAASSLCKFTKSEPVLSEGSSGAAVKQVQCEYNYATRGTNLTVDGSFGPKTDAAIRRFQKCVKIDVDGSVGPVTWSHLNYWHVQGGYPADC